MGGILAGGLGGNGKLTGLGRLGTVLKDGLIIGFKGGVMAAAFEAGGNTKLPT